MTHSPRPRAGPGCSGQLGQACQAVGGAGAGVVDGDHDAVGRGPDAYGHGRTAVALCVADRLGDADQQVVESGAGDAAGADLRERVPGIGGGAVDQLNGGAGVFERVGRWGQAFEDLHSW